MRRARIARRRILARRIHPHACVGIRDDAAGSSFTPEGPLS